MSEPTVNYCANCGEPCSSRWCSEACFRAEDAYYDDDDEWPEDEDWIEDGDDE